MLEQYLINHLSPKAFSICDEYHPKTCQKEAIEKNHLQVVKETASPRDNTVAETLACSLTKIQAQVA